MWGCQGTPLTRVPPHLLAVGVEHMECEIKLEAPASPDRDIGADVDSGKGLEDPEECKKRKRKPYRPGECHLGLPPRTRTTPHSPRCDPTFSFPLPTRYRWLHGAAAQVSHPPEEGLGGAGRSGARGAER